MSFFAQYPASASGSSNASVGVNGAAIPLSSTEIGAEDPSGDLQPLQVDASGNLLISIADSPASPLHVIVDSSALPTGAATSANQVTELASLASIDGKLGSLGQKTMAGSAPVVLASDQSAVPISAASLPLPNGAATSDNQDIGNLSLQQISTNTSNIILKLDAKLGDLGQKNMAGSAPVVIASDQSTLPVSAASLPLPSGAATAALQTQISGQLPSTLGTHVTSASLAVNIASDQTVPVSASALPLPTGAATETTLSSLNGKFGSLGQKNMAGSAPVVISSDQASIPVAATLAAGSAIIGNVRIDQTTPGTTNGVQINAALPAGANIIGALSANQSTNIAQINGVTPLMGNGVTGTGSLRVTLASDTSSNTNPLLVAETVSTTSSVTSVASSASSVSLLASNSSRKNATFYNDSAQILYLKLGATASATSYTIQIPPNGYYELPIGKIYTGAIDGIWASADGNARITELT